MDRIGLWVNQHMEKNCNIVINAWYINTVEQLPFQIQRRDSNYPKREERGWDVDAS